MNNFMYPYNAEYAQVPMQMQMQSAPMLNGKFIAEIKDVSANDVPLNGRPAIFVKNDMSEIYTKMWNADGTITTNTFKRITDSTPTPVADDVAELVDRLDTLEGKISARFEKIEKAVKAKLKEETA